MNLGRLVNIDKYLYEIIDDYKNSNSEEEKNDIFKSFCSSIWASENKRRVYAKNIRFSVRKDLMNEDIGQIFNIWSEVEYKGYKAISKETDWCSLIRQKVNNLYTRYFDKDVILKKDYMYLLNTPKRLYFQWLNGAEMNPDELAIIINNSIDEAEKLKSMYQQQKMSLSWKEYKKVIEGFFQRCFDNCKLIEDYEKESKYCNIYNFMNEDNFYIKYFCDRLDGNMKDYQKKYYGLKYSSRNSYKRCKNCGGLIENTGNKKMYCDKCAVETEKYNAKLRKRKQRNRCHEIENNDFA